MKGASGLKRGSSAMARFCTRNLGGKRLRPMSPSNTGRPRRFSSCDWMVPRYLLTSKVAAKIATATTMTRKMTPAMIASLRMVSSLTLRAIRVSWLDGLRATVFACLLTSPALLCASPQKQWAPMTFSFVEDMSSQSPGAPANGARLSDKLDPGGIPPQDSGACSAPSEKSEVPEQLLGNEPTGPGTTVP